VAHDTCDFCYWLLVWNISLGAGAPTPGTEQKAAVTAGQNFGQVFDQVGEVINNLKAGEAAAISGLQGQTPVQNVVESLMTAERSPQTAVSIRDKVVSAYQSISQMAI
jgi:flagellar hook-basal body complex protein FliE